MFCVTFTTICLLLVPISIASNSEQHENFRGNQLHSNNYDKNKISTSNADQKIIEGRNATRKEIPWQVNLKLRGYFICGGSIINNHWVLTAAHCFQSSDLARDYTVLVGTVNIVNLDDSARSFTASQLIAHPYSGPDTLRYDVALIKIEGSFVYNEYISPISLMYPNCNMSVEDIRGIKCNISGWGVTGQGDTASLQVAEVPLVTPPICQEYYNGSAIITPDMICAGDVQRACSGDSGGPLMCKIWEENKWFLVGATSFGLRGCLRGPDVFARIDYVYYWIVDTIITK